MNRYTKMYGWLYHTFGTATFTIDEFRMMFPSPQPTKIIHDLIKSEFMRRTKRGTYQVVKPDEFVHNIVKENVETRHILSQATKQYAYTHSTAVNIWTEGYYWTDFTKGFKPIHITIRRSDVPYWIEFFRQNDAEYVFESESKTVFGVTYVLHPKETVSVDIKDGTPVVPLKEIVQYCKNNRIVYQPALEYLDKKYHLGLFDSYEQVTS
ncbi:MAG: hypothetical protein WC525_07985 [Candidatus Thermoplasmatota archaeon]